MEGNSIFLSCSNNTNKLSPQERIGILNYKKRGSNNTNKLSPQEQHTKILLVH